MRNRAVTSIAGCFALSAFTVAIIAGMAAGNTAASILRRALLALVICYPVGLLVGGVARRVVEEHLATHRAGHSEEDEGGPGVSEASEIDEEPIVV